MVRKMRDGKHGNTEVSEDEMVNMRKSVSFFNGGGVNGRKG